jgi:predicted type IV restriction endonuclease
MSLLNALNTILSKLEKDEFANEQAIKQGVVLRILTHLGWDSFEPTVVWPEYSVPPRRVDYALCHPAKKPAVFIEVKQPGQTDAADKQLFEYAFHEGVPLAVLTDGQTWSFYLPSGQGSYDDRRVYRLDLLERKPEEAVEKLERYLQQSRIASGAAFDAAQSDYKSRSRQQQTKAVIPEAWKELVDAEDSRLLDLLSEATERRGGVQPARADLTDFLSRIRFAPTVMQLGVAPTRVAPATPVPTNSSAISERTGTTPGGSWFRLNGKTYQVRTAKEVVLGVLRELECRQPGFLERCSRHEENQGRTRSYIGRTADELYPGRPDFAQDSDMHAQIVPGWLLMTNFSNQVKRSVLALAAQVAGIRLREGEDYSL